MTAGPRTPFLPASGAESPTPRERVQAWARAVQGAFSAEPEEHERRVVAFFVRALLEEN
jgi:hypothetical protein